jgi:hypothetical protein
MHTKLTYIAALFVATAAAVAVHAAPAAAAGHRKRLRRKCSATV